MILRSSKSVSITLMAFLGLRAASAALFILTLTALTSMIANQPVPNWYAVMLALTGALVAACAHRLERLAGAS